MAFTAVDLFMLVLLGGILLRAVYAIASNAKVRHGPHQAWPHKTHSSLL